MRNAWANARDIMLLVLLVLLLCALFPFTVLGFFARGITGAFMKGFNMDIRDILPL